MNVRMKNFVCKQKFVKRNIELINLYIYLLIYLINHYKQLNNF